MVHKHKDDDGPWVGRERFDTRREAVEFAVNHDGFDCRHDVFATTPEDLRAHWLSEARELGEHDDLLDASLAYRKCARQLAAMTEFAPAGVESWPTTFEESVRWAP